LLQHSTVSDYCVCTVSSRMLHCHTYIANSYYHDIVSAPLLEVFSPVHVHFRFTFGKNEDIFTRREGMLYRSQSILRPRIQPHMDSASANAYFYILQLTLLN